MESFPESNSNERVGMRIAWMTLDEEIFKHNNAHPLAKIARVQTSPVGAFVVRPREIASDTPPSLHVSVSKNVLEIRRTSALGPVQVDTVSLDNIFRNDVIELVKRHITEQMEIFTAEL